MVWITGKDAKKNNDLLLSFSSSLRFKKNIKVKDNGSEP